MTEEEKQALETMEEISPLVLKVVDVWQRRGKNIFKLTNDEIKEAILYKY